MQQIVRMAVPVMLVAFLSACANNTARNEPVYSPSRGEPVYNSSRQPATTVAFGHVRSIESLGNSQGQATGAGAVVGGVVGAIVGRQFADSSRGKNVGTVAGAVGGALVGNEIEKNNRSGGAGVRVTVQLERGGQRSFDFDGVGDLRVGDRVRIDGDRLYKL